MKRSVKLKWLIDNENGFKPLSIIVCLIFILSLVSTAMTQKESDVFPVPETYQVEGIPKIKKSEVEKLFYKPSDIRSNLIWDADRKNKRLFVTDRTNNIYLIDKPLGETKKLLKNKYPYRVKTSPSGNYLAFIDDNEKKDNFQLSILKYNNKSIKRLSNLKGKDESVDSFVWSEKGNSLFYSKVDYEAKTSKLCKNDLLKNKCFQTKLKGIWYVLDESNNKILLKYWKASSNQQLFVFDIQSEKLAPIAEKGNNRRGFFVKDRVFWTTAGNENCRKEPCILSKDLKNGITEQLKLPENLTNISDVKISPKRKYIVIQETNSGIDNLRVFKLKKNKIAKEFPSFISGSFVIWNIRWLSDNEIVYTLENVSTPSSIQSYNFKTKKTTNWTKGKLPEQLVNKVEMPEFIKWKSFDDLHITGYVVRPKKSPKKSPVLIYVHGGPQIIDQPVFSSQDILFASNLGMTIIHTNIRGSSGFGKEFMDADNREKRGDAVKDIQALIKWIEKQPDLDANQIYLRGESYGGFIVLSTALQEPDKIKAVIAEYPLVSISSYLSQSWIDEFTKEEYGDPQNKELMSNLDKLSPLNNTKNWNNIPLFLTRGKFDKRSFEKDVIDLKTQLQNKNSEVWFIYSIKAGHGFSGRYVTASMYKFLKKQINKER